MHKSEQLVILAVALLFLSSCGATENTVNEAPNMTSQVTEEEQQQAQNTVPTWEERNPPVASAIPQTGMTQPVPAEYLEPANRALLSGWTTSPKIMSGTVPR